jgi:hypothetical protein
MISINLNLDVIELAAPGYPALSDSWKQQRTGLKNSGTTQIRLSQLRLSRSYQKGHCS